MHFDRDDIQAVETLARNTIARGPFDADTKSQISIGKNTIGVSYRRAPNVPIGGDLGVSELRGDFDFLGSQEILIRSHGARLPENDASFEHCVGVIAHEVVHSLQVGLLSDQQLHIAIEANKYVKLNPNCPDCYASYIGCCVELPAHAAMIAFSLRDSSSNGFDVSAQKSEFYQYFEAKLKASKTGHETLEHILERARCIHANF